MLGIRGIALSVPAGEEPVDFDALRPWFSKVLRSLLVEVTTPRLVNVNFPREPRGIVWTRAAVQHYDGRIFPAKDPLGRDVYWFSVTSVDAADQATDRWAVEQRWISMTPLDVDPTDADLGADCCGAPDGHGDGAGSVAPRFHIRGCRQSARRGGRDLEPWIFSDALPSEDRARPPLRTTGEPPRDLLRHFSDTWRRAGADRSGDVSEHLGS